MKKLIITSLLVLLLFTHAGFSQHLKPIAYSDGAQKLNGLITSNSGTKLSGVLVLPAWKGIDEEAKNAALALEKQGHWKLPELSFLFRALHPYMADEARIVQG